MLYLYHKRALIAVRDLAWIGNELPYDKCGGFDGGNCNSMKFEALEADLFEQRTTTVSRCSLQVETKQGLKIEDHILI